MSEITIISGGQTGVDRGALDAALALGAPCGGWCPEGRKAEDGPIDPRYPLVELPGGGYRQRTRQNVIDSDATVIIYFGRLEAGSGTWLTVRFCEREQKPHLLIDGQARGPEQAARQLLDFCRAHEALRLNVAGPRASLAAEAHDYTRALITSLLEQQAGELR